MLLIRTVMSREDNIVAGVGWGGVGIKAELRS